MKKKFINFLILLSTIYFTIELIKNKELVFSTVNNSINLFTKNVFPSLFPFFILSDILINYDLAYYFGLLFKKPFNKIFLIKSEASVIIFLSMISGFPSSAKNIRTLYDKGILNEKEASKILAWSHFSNPLFVLGTVSTFFLNNKRLGIIILLSHYISNFIVGIIIRKYYPKTELSIIQKNEKKEFSVILAKAITNSINTLGLILGTITIFLIISTILVNKLNLNAYNEMILKGILEITQGIKALSLLNIDEIYKVVLSTMFLSFGGLSVHLQIVSQITETKISYKLFLLGRILQTIISGIISYHFYYLF